MHCGTLLHVWLLCRSSCVDGFMKSFMAQYFLSAAMMIFAVKRPIILIVGNFSPHLEHFFRAMRRRSTIVYSLYLLFSFRPTFQHVVLALNIVINIFAYGSLRMLVSSVLYHSYIAINCWHNNYLC